MGERFVDCVVRILNVAYQLDRDAVERTLLSQTACNDAMSDSPHIIVGADIPDGPGYLSGLSLINSIVEAYAPGDRVCFTEQEDPTDPHFEALTVIPPENKDGTEG
jgi:hypothetical protein